MLPVETTLIVKEHKGNNGFHVILSFVSGITIPAECIEMLQPWVPELKLDKYKACAVMVLTGRVGWEALVRGVPVIGFGNTFWSDHVSVIKPPQTPEKFSAALQALSDLNRKQLSVDTEYTEKMAAAYIDCVKPGVFVHGAKRFLTKENYQLVARGILELLTKRAVLANRRTCPNDHRRNYSHFLYAVDALLQRRHGFCRIQSNLQFAAWHVRFSTGYSKKQKII